MMKNQANSNGLTTLRRDQVPFKTELHRLPASQELRTAVMTKPYSDFISSCRDPKHLIEVLELKKAQTHFPSAAKIKRIIFIAASASALSFVVGGRKIARIVKCNVLKAFMPKKQYSDAL